MRCNSLTFRIITADEGYTEFMVSSKIGNETDFEITVLDSQSLLNPQGKINLSKNRPLNFGITWIIEKSCHDKMKLKISQT